MADIEINKSISLSQSKKKEAQFDTALSAKTLFNSDRNSIGFDSSEIGQIGQIGQEENH
jgi:hypothetical protein